MNKQSLNGHLQECLCEIEALLVSEGFRDTEIREKCIIESFEDGFNCDQIIEMWMASIHFEKAYCSFETTKRVGKGKIIPICVIRRFVKHFFDYLEHDELVDAIERIFRISLEGNEKFHFEQGAHISTIIKRATQIGVEEEIHCIDDFVDYLRGRNDNIVKLIQEDAFSEMECCSAS